MSEHELPEECFYTREDEWVRHDGDRTYLGITDYAQDQLGDIVFLELPEVGATISQGEVFGVIESVKAVSDLYAPISGEILEVNADLAETPEVVNESCYSDGWLLAIKVSDTGEFDTLMNAPDYAQYTQERQD